MIMVFVGSELNSEGLVIRHVLVLNFRIIVKMTFILLTIGFGVFICFPMEIS